MGGGVGEPELDLDLHKLGFLGFRVLGGEADAVGLGRRVFGGGSVELLKERG